MVPHTTINRSCVCIDLLLNLGIGRESIVSTSKSEVTRLSSSKQQDLPAGVYFVPLYICILLYALSEERSKRDVIASARHLLRIEQTHNLDLPAFLDRWT